MSFFHCVDCGEREPNDTLLVQIKSQTYSMSEFFLCPCGHEEGMYDLTVNFEFEVDGFPVPFTVCHECRAESELGIEIELINDRRCKFCDDTEAEVIFMKKSTIYVVDADYAQSQTYARELERMFAGTRFTICTTHPPLREKSDYRELLEKTDTACFILEQRLKTTGMATYTGLELAEYLHQMNSQLPIYILTNFVDELFEYVGIYGIAEIIPKDIFRSVSQDALRSRIMARIDTRDLL